MGDQIAERVAEALWNGDKQPHDPDWSRGLGDWLVAHTRKLATTAISTHITALKEAGMVVVPREPSEAMLDASGEERALWGRMAEIYRAMTRAALKGETG